MDSAMDSLSTTSERSNASSSIGGSPNNNNNNNNNNSVVKPSMSPSMPLNHSTRDNINNHNSSNNNNNNNNNTSGQRTTSNSSSLHNNNHDNHLRNSSVSPLHHSRSPRSSPLDCGPGGGGGGGNGIPQQLHSLHHSLSPPHVSTPNNLSVMAPRMSQGIPHLPPHGIGLLNSLQMIHHGSPLELMAAAHHQMPPRTYNSPPPISSSDPTANECKLVEYRGQKVAAFIIGGDTMLCLPQAFELFLKHLVGGLHTVYTKLKRLDIVPLVCNVEQVRILRGLGAIQPGVNRCKLLSCKDFDILYRDCTTARSALNSAGCLSVKPPESSRPGRPPKRGPVGLSLSSSHMSHHPHLKKHRLDNGDYSYENGHLNDDDLIVRKRGRPCNSWRRTVDAEMEQIEISRLDKSPLLANGYNAPPTHLNPLQYMQMSHHPNAANLMNSSISAHNLGRPDGSGVMGGVKPGQTGIPSVEAIARSGIWENCRAAYEDIVKHLERLRDEKVDERGIVRDHKLRDLSSQNGSSSNGHSPILNLSKSGIDHSVGEPSDHSEEDHRSPVPTLHEDDDNLSDHNDSDNDDREDKDDNSDYSEVDCEIPPVSSASSAPGSAAEQHHQALNYTSMAMQQATNQQEAEQNLSSTETLLRNIQNLIKVATENARQQERQTSYEKAELKMDVLREREVKDSLERQLNDERRLRVLYQKRFKREKKVRSRIQQQLELEIKRRAQLEDVLKSSGGVGVVNPVALENLSRGGNESIENCDRPSSVSDKIKPENAYSNTNNCDTREPSVQSQSQSQQSQAQLQAAAERRERESSRNERDANRETNASTTHPQQTSSASSTSSTTTPTTNNDGKPWNYPNIDLMATGAFWHNYTDSIAHEIEMERKVRQQSGESDIKSPIQDRPNYYKNSVLFTSAT